MSKLTSLNIDNIINVESELKKPDEYILKKFKNIIESKETSQIGLVFLDQDRGQENIIHTIKNRISEEKDFQNLQEKLHILKIPTQEDALSPSLINALKQIAFFLGMENMQVFVLEHSKSNQDSVEDEKNQLILTTLNYFKDQPFTISDIPTIMEGVYLTLFQSFLSGQETTNPKDFNKEDENSFDTESPNDFGSESPKSPDFSIESSSESNSVDPEGVPTLEDEKIPQPSGWPAKFCAYLSKSPKALTQKKLEKILSSSDLTDFSLPPHSQNEPVKGDINSNESFKQPQNKSPKKSKKNMPIVPAAPPMVDLFNDSFPGVANTCSSLFFKMPEKAKTTTTEQFKGKRKKLEAKTSNGGIFNKRQKRLPPANQSETPRSKFTPCSGLSSEII